MSFFFAMKKGDDDENKFSPPTPKIIEPFLFSAVVSKRFDTTAFSISLLVFFFFVIVVDYML